VEGARLATVDDIADIVAVAASHRGSMLDQRGADLFLQREAGPVDVGDRVRQALASDDNAVVVGTYDDIVFGYGLIGYEALLDGSRLARLHHFLVDAEIRKSGIGEAMMNLVVDLATEQGCIGVDSVALPGDRDTKNFFESFGLKARLLTVHRSLSDATEDESA
jgi:GNAT superfamily N-acetyltransferase